MFFWFDSLPIFGKWLIGVLTLPFICFLLGWIVVSFEPSAATDVKSKSEYTLKSIFLGFVASGYLAAIFGCTVLSRSLIGSPVLSFVIGLLLGMFVFTCILWGIQGLFGLLVNLRNGKPKVKND